MGLDAAGFNPNNIQQPKIVNNPNISNVDKTAPVQKPDGISNAPTFNLENTVSFKNINAGKAKEFENVVFDNDSVGISTMQTVANKVGDINKGAIYEAAKAVLSDLRAQYS